MHYVSCFIPIKKKMTLTVNVKDNNIEQALRNLKKKITTRGFI